MSMQPSGLKRWARPAGGLSGLGQVPPARRLRRHAGEWPACCAGSTSPRPDGRWHDATTPS